MIDRLELLLRRARSRLSLARSEGTAAQAGLVVIQIDGLSRRELEDALDHGRMPFLKKLLAAEGYRLLPVYPLRILTYNVHRCMGMDGKLSPERIARVIARHTPDVVALQEPDVGRERIAGSGR
jgi:hypothetical protein